jgi:hypothetical protein
MPPVGFEPTILLSERPQTNSLDRAATGIGIEILGDNFGILTDDGSGAKFRKVV